MTAKHALVIGTGSIGQRHIRNIRALAPQTRFTLLRREARRDGLADELGARVVLTLAEALADAPDYALVATPSALHAEVLVPLIQAGLPCYIEKPVVTTAAQIQAVTDAMAASGYHAPTLVGCNLRFLPSLRLARAIIADGRLGTVVRASLQAGQWLPDWRPAQDYRQGYGASRALGGGVVLDLIHELDAARFLLGEFSSVQALVGRLSGLEIETEDVACALLGRPGGPFVSVSLDYVSRQPVRRYELVGDEATLVWDLRAGRLELAHSKGVEPLDAGAAAFDVPATYPAAMAEFLAALEVRTPTSQDLADGLASLRLALAVKDAAAIDRPAFGAK